jgi:chemotaxis protein CheY-P-specific phosphatase CheC
MTSALDRGDGVSREMKLKITNAAKDVMNNMVDSFMKSLKNNFKEAYNKANANASTHNPFYIAPPANPNF